MKKYDYINRPTYINQIKPYINKDLVKIITGIRRSGKSTLMELIKEELIEQGIKPEKFLSHDFNSLDDKGYKDIKDTYNTIKKHTSQIEGRAYLFFDEIQDLTEWERLINSCMSDFDCDVYITGSNAKMLSDELATLMTGRYLTIRVYPFSYEEICSFKGAKDEAFDYYLIYGGLPVIYSGSYNRDAALNLISDIFDSILINDISKRYNIRNIELFKRIVKFLFENIGHTFSAKSIVNYLKNESRSTSNEVIYNYIDHCRTAYLIDLVNREDIAGKRILKTQEKIYLTDHGFREALLRNNENHIDQTLENIIYIELLRRGYSVNVGSILTNSTNDKEVDFIIERDKDRAYIQVSYLLSSEQTMEREFGALEKIRDSYPKYVLSLDQYDRSRNGIKHVNIKDFLLNPLL